MLSTNYYLLLPPLLQGIVLGIDDLYFHRKRTMVVWERWGHPLDTLTFLICILYLIFAQNANVVIYGCLAGFSSLFITKDEWFHARYAPPTEHWLHAVAFVLHPVVLMCAYFLRSQTDLLSFYAVSIGLFALYQIFYWNFFKNKATDPI